VILMLDNYDSFTYNLVQGLSEISEVEVEVVRNDSASPAELLARGPRAVVISPGPGRPEQAGISVELVLASERVPLLGICLGLQALAVALGGQVVGGPEPVHGKISSIHHGRTGLFDGIHSPFEATRYHSLVVDRESLPGDLELTAWTADGLVMGVRHRSRPHFGLQFHPESYLCREGMDLLANFLRLAGVPLAARWTRTHSDPRDG
jgi:anthranilate synthase component II